MKVLIKFPSRSRPDKFFRCLDNITQNAKHSDYQILCTFDIDDPSMFNEEVKEKLKAYPKAKAYWGTSRDKVDAINRDMEFANPWDIVINMSDDMWFVKPGFDLEIIKDFEREGLDVLMHYPDNKAGKNLITMAIMGRTYYDRFGFIYNPEYKSLFCDNEQQEVAKLLGRYVFSNKRLFDHNHPAWGLCDKDDQYIHTESFWKEDEATFHRRKAINFEC